MNAAKVQTHKELSNLPPKSIRIRAPNWNSDIEKLIPKINELDKCRIKLSEQLVPPKVAIFMARGDHLVPISSLGNLTTIIGKPKSRKSFLITMLVAAALKPGGVGPFRGALPEGKKRVAVFDTEQGRYHVQKMAKRICGLTGDPDPKYLEVYSLRKYSPKERVAIIRDYIYNTDDLGLIVIDGIRDLMRDVNDPGESMDLVSLLLKWSDERQIHILNVLHQNKGDGNARGHLGGEMVNRSEFTLSVAIDTRNPDYSITKTEFGREIHPDPITFTIDESGLPVVVSDFHVMSDTKAKKPEDVETDEHLDILAEVFGKIEKPKYKQLCDLLESEFRQRGFTFGKTKISALPKWYQEQDWIKLEGTPGTRHSYYNYNNLLA
ncbi:AAA family ATPase [Dyadobacter sp. 3J3]|uniref:AAA family ATPase n=1 Tax=Dyadobacter sp. 3J3 TaxID=2606600 RepID=UPI0013587AF7|nr:AAA family ATPase [Dyadobacter sp. 3J3]